MKPVMYGVGGLIVYLVLHLIAYSEPSLLILTVTLVWFQAEFDDWDYSYVIIGILPAMIVASLETLL